MRGLIMSPGPLRLAGMSLGLMLACGVLTGCGRSQPRRAPLPAPVFEAVPAESRDILRAAWETANKSPEDPEPNGKLGMMLLALEQPAPAAAALERASEEQPDNFSWLYYLGMAQAAAGRPAAAVPTLRKALHIRPSFVPLQLKLTESLVAAGRLQEGERACRAILLEHPDAAPAHKMLAAIYKGAGETTLAQNETSLADKFADLPAETLAYLKDPWIAAVTPAKSLKAASPKIDDRAAHFEKGRQLMVKKKFKKAIEELLQTLTPHDGETPGYLYSLSMAYSLAGDFENATRYGIDAKALAVQQGKTQLAEAIDEHLNRLRVQVMQMQPPSAPQPQY